MRGKKTKHVYNQNTIVVNKKEFASKTVGFTRLKDNVLFIMDGGKNKVLQISSSISGESKTTVACNLAVLLGQTDKKVCVLDLDFQKANDHRVFGLDNTKGLNEYMLETATVDEIIQHTEYKNVDLLSRGGAIYNPSLVLISDRFKTLMETLREKYDVVVVDTAPVLQTSDYIHVSKYSDATIFLVATGRTKKTQVREAISELKKNDVNIIGTVLTFYDPKYSNDMGYYKGSYYYYYSNK